MAERIAKMINRLLFHGGATREVPMPFGVDWIVLAANATGLLLVLLASQGAATPADLPAPNLAQTVLLAAG